MTQNLSTTDVMQRTDPVVAINGLTHRYGERVALDDLRLSINRGEIFGFLGPNGSGKTTLFRLLCTLIPAPADTVNILGKDLRREAQWIREQLGVVFQSPSLDKQLTAAENLRHHGHLYGIYGKALADRVDELLGRVNLAERRDEYVGQFSGGMRRRVELAKGLLNRPSILLLDEPSTGLDPGARIDLWNQLRQIQASGQVTILLTTHLMEEAERCDRLAIMDRGRLVACDSPVRLKERIGGDVITIQTGEPDKATAILRDQFGIAAEVIDNTLRFEKERGHAFIPAMIESLPGLVDSVSVGKPTLEDVFIRVTGRGFEPLEPKIESKRTSKWA